MRAVSSERAASRYLLFLPARRRRQSQSSHRSARSNANHTAKLGAHHAVRSFTASRARALAGKPIVATPSVQPSQAPYRG
jgi:hypothetical protein